MYDLLLYTTNAVIATSMLIAVLALVVYPSVSLSLKLFSIYAVVGTCVDILSYTYSLKGLNNLYFFHFYTFFEFLILTLSFETIYLLLGKKTYLKVALFTGCVLILLNSLFLQDLHSFNSYSATFVSIAILAYCLYFFNLFLDNPSDNVEMKTLKWVIICVFLYHAVSIVVLLFSNILLGISEEAQFLVWSIRSIMILIIKIMLLITYLRLYLYFHKKPFYE